MKNRVVFFATLLLVFGWVKVEADSLEIALKSVDWAKFQSLPIQDEGRIKPLDTFARSLLLQFSGKSTLKTEAGKLSAIQWLMQVLFQREAARDYPVFLVENSEILQDLGIKFEKDRDRYSYNTLFPKMQRLHKRALEADHTEKKARTALQNQSLNLYHNLDTFRSLLNTFSFLDSMDTPSRKEVEKELGKAPTFLEYFAFYVKKSNEIANKKPNEILMRLLAVQPRNDSVKRDIIQFIDSYSSQESIYVLTEVSSVWILSNHPFANEILKRLLLVHLENQIFASVEQDIIRFRDSHASRALAIFSPSDANSKIAWQSPWEIVYFSFYHRDSRKSLVKDLLEMREAYQTCKWTELNSKVGQFHKEIVSLTEKRMEYGKILLEVKYNRYDLFFISSICYLVSMILCSLSWIGWWDKKFYRSALLVLIVGFLVHTAGIILRMLIQGRPPVTNLYETILFAGWGCTATSFFLEVFFRKTITSIGILTGSVLGATLLFVAGKYAVEGDTMGVLMAVLDSNFWLTTHVITITIGYCACFMAGLMGHVFILMFLLAPVKATKHADELYRAVYGSICFATIFAFIGTVLGGLWADQSWGRFWGWDPKENGALLIVLWNALLLHARNYIKAWGMALGAIFGNVVVAMAWWGVNLLNIGLHSYGFTSGLFQKLMIFTVIEIGFILLGVFLCFLTHMRSTLCGSQTLQQGK